jgi:hypothetical protein
MNGYLDLWGCDKEEVAVSLSSEVSSKEDIQASFNILSSS